MRKGLVVLALLGILALVRSDGNQVTAQAGLDSAHQHEATSNFQPLPVAVDGAKTPEKIPDDVAYAHFLSVVALKSTPSRVELGRRKAILNSTGLHVSDAERIVTALAGVREQLAEVESQRKQVTHENFASIQSLALSASLRTRQQTILRDARYRVIGTLSSDGVRILQDHIERRVKPRIVIYGDPRP
ncbi:MAG: hypothetical protein ACRD3G_25655 [Vicinamibacterales bacterium]